MGIKRLADTYGRAVRARASHPQSGIRHRSITVDPDSINDMAGRALRCELVDAVTRLTRTEREARVERLIAGCFRAARRGRAARRD